MKYLDIAERTLVARIVRPFSTDASTEIRLASKVYGFDTSFICFAKGWNTIRFEQYGELWEHIVLNNIMGIYQHMEIKYWRTKSGHEIDFILQKNRNKHQIALESKWTSRSFNAKNMIAFGRKYPEGPNYVVASDVEESFERDFEDITVTFISLEELCNIL